ncbi:hypothetical protein SCHPADRAFT_597808 [Schizopora paradoxa]|uniref:F-box domain-containing protein n=1 Tax=Schizopora paradoxa TaxID=27342 RepID=A0A0H2RA45_9AGAM|nr:hypothetical protein SCHPADRAFT_597808 [Schizopora paradoxa]
MSHNSTKAFTPIQRSSSSHRVMADVLGRFGYRHKGIYYVRDRYFGGEPEHLGHELVAKIPTFSDDFKRWVDRARRIISKEFHMLKQAGDEFFEDFSYDELGDTSIDVSDDDFKEEDWYLEGFHPEYDDDYAGYDMAFHPTFHPVDLKGNSWTYVYDLDNLLFTVEDSIHFRLDNVPRGADGFDKYIYADGLGMLCRSPLLPADYIPDTRLILPLTPQEAEDKRTFESSMLIRIDASQWMDDIEADRALAASHKITVLVAEGLISGGYSILTSLDWSYDRTIQRISKEILTAASSGGSCSSFTFEHQCMEQWVTEDRDPFYTTEHRSCTMFWFRGRLIVLTKVLHNEDRFKATVGLVIRRARAFGSNECVAILWSFDHVAVVVIANNKVSCSEAIPVVAAFGQDEVRLKEALGLIAHYLPLPCSQGSPSFICRLPLDVVILVMDYADSESAEHLGRTSKALRHEWLRRPRIGPFSILKMSDDDDDGFMAKDQRSSGELVRIRLQPPKCVPYFQYAADLGRKQAVHHDVHCRARSYFPFSRIKYQLFVEKYS